MNIDNECFSFWTFISLSQTSQLFLVKRESIKSGIKWHLNSILVGSYDSGYKIMNFKPKSQAEKNILIKLQYLPHDSK